MHFIIVIGFIALHGLQVDLDSSANEVHFVLCRTQTDMAKKG